MGKKLDDEVFFCYTWRDLLFTLATVFSIILFAFGMSRLEALVR